MSLPDSLALSEDSLDIASSEQMQTCRLPIGPILLALMITMPATYSFVQYRGFRHSPLASQPVDDITSNALAGVAMELKLKRSVVDDYTTNLETLRKEVRDLKQVVRSRASDRGSLSMAAGTETSDKAHAATLPMPTAAPTIRQPAEQPKKLSSDNAGCHKLKTKEARFLHMIACAHTLE